MLSTTISLEDTTEEAEQEWTQEVYSTKAAVIIGGTASTPGYIYNLQGQRDPRARCNQPYRVMLGSNHYFANLEAFREGDKIPSLITA